MSGLPPWSSWRRLVLSDGTPLFCHTQHSLFFGCPPVVASHYGGLYKFQQGCINYWGAGFPSGSLPKFCLNQSDWGIANFTRISANRDPLTFISREIRKMHNFRENERTKNNRHKISVNSPREGTLYFIVEKHHSCALFVMNFNTRRRERKKVMQCKTIEMSWLTLMPQKHGMEMRQII